MGNNQKLDGVLFTAIHSKKQVNEFKKVFAKSINLSNVDANRWKLTLRKSENDIKILKLVFDGETINSWAVLNVPIAKITMEILKGLNADAEKLFREEWFYGIKDKEALQSMLGSVDNCYFGYEPYPTVIYKAAYFWYNIATKQMFHNGNKRTALLTSLLFLKINGYQFEIKDGNMLYDISMNLANKKMSEAKLREYIKRNVTIDFEMMEKIWEKVKNKKVDDNM